ncbi:hypothetical protein [Xanthomonas sacchari]|uniref:Uncharacterized protein n=1 Tax=Xanthomonas sacchari TaxID=56458 RepID=A0A2P5Z124_9XANT|nr:hypothetical protein [Xanthomonas sacchari]MDV0439575.1 hypothetical protein [Xanthomonas sacchari]PPU81095.1 hypothetical protein XsacCFBP4641_16100 [Xanthomonas sacchari]
MRPHRVLAPALAALRAPLTVLAAAPQQIESALLDRLQAGDLTADSGAPGPATRATPRHVDPALIADVVAWVRALPASHGAAP